MKLAIVLLILPLLGCQPSGEKRACSAAFGALEQMNSKPDVFLHFQECTGYEPIAGIEGGARIRVHMGVELQGDGGGSGGLPGSRTRMLWSESYQDCELHGDTVRSQPMVAERGCTALDAPPGESDWCGTPGSGPPKSERITSLALRPVVSP